MYGWHPDEALSTDENYLDMMMLITRNSTCRQGCMGCVLVDASRLTSNEHQTGSLEHASSLEESPNDYQKSIYNAVIGAATNTPLFSDFDSDVHAEIGALGVAACKGNQTEACTAYITMPPCKRCFAALFVSGVKRIVTLQLSHDSIMSVARKHGIEMVDASKIISKEEQQLRISNIIRDSGGDKDLSLLSDIAEQRKRKREEKQLRKKKAMLKNKKGTSPNLDKIVE
jgi:deoxycytidylate deaminase